MNSNEPDKPISKNSLLFRKLQVILNQGWWVQKGRLSHCGVQGSEDAADIYRPRGRPRTFIIAGASWVELARGNWRKINFAAEIEWFSQLLPVSIWGTKFQELCATDGTAVKDPYASEGGECVSTNCFHEALTVSSDWMSELELGARSQPCKLN